MLVWFPQPKVAWETFAGGIDVNEIFRIPITDVSFYLHILLMGVNSNFYSLQIFFLKSDKICVGIIFKQNFELPSILFQRRDSSGHKMKYAWELRWLNRYVRVFLYHDAVTKRVIVNILKLP